MKLSFLIGGAIGYVLGAKAGRERYETIVRVGRRFAGSQTVQSTAGVLQARFDTIAHHVRGSVSRPPAGHQSSSQHGANGYHR